MSAELNVLTVQATYSHYNNLKQPIWSPFLITVCYGTDHHLNWLCLTKSIVTVFCCYTKVKILQYFDWNRYNGTHLEMLHQLHPLVVDLQKPQTQFFLTPLNFNKMLPQVVHRTQNNASILLLQGFKFLLNPWTVHGKFNVRSLAKRKQLLITVSHEAEPLKTEVKWYRFRRPA